MNDERPLEAPSDRFFFIFFFGPATTRASPLRSDPRDRRSNQILSVIASLGIDSTSTRWCGVEIYGARTDHGRFEPPWRGSLRALIPYRLATAPWIFSHSSSGQTTTPIIGLRTLEDFRQSTPAIAERRVQMQLMLAFALVALAVSAGGVYGVSSYATQARRREFGIRMALGAQRRDIFGLALRDGANVTALGGSSARVGARGSTSGPCSTT